MGMMYDNYLIKLPQRSCFCSVNSSTSGLFLFHAGELTLFIVIGVKAFLKASNSSMSNFFNEILVKFHNAKSF